MAADTQWPQRLVSAGLASDLHVYTSGKLVLVSNVVQDAGCEVVLKSAHLKFVAVANPELASYGLAAKQYLQQQNLWQSLQNRLVMGKMLPKPRNWCSAAMPLLDCYHRHCYQMHSDRINVGDQFPQSSTKKSIK